MYTRSQGPGRTMVVIDEGDHVVLTDLAGSVVAGPHPAPPEQAMVIQYDGPYLKEVCWGVLNPDGTLAFQSETLGSMSRGVNVQLELHRPDDDHLTPADRKWLNVACKFAD